MLFARCSSGLTCCALLVAAALVGCGSNQAGDPDPKGPQAAGAHEGWWCGEHGVPEYMCSQCNDEYAAECKKKGDWCKVHGDRARSQCFKCNPALYKHFEEMYVAKYGKKPEPPPASEFQN